MSALRPVIVAVASDHEHRFGKVGRDRIELVAGLGVAGDAHFGATVQHRSRAARTPAAPNLRQVHLIGGELFEDLARAGHAVSPGQLGENITTRGIDLLGLPRGTRLQLGSAAVIELTGLRNPCRQIDDNLGAGAMAAVLDRADDGRLMRKAGVMAVVVAGGQVRPGDPIEIALPPDFMALEPV